MAPISESADRPRRHFEEPAVAGEVDEGLPPIFIAFLGNFKSEVEVVNLRNGVKIFHLHQRDMDYIRERLGVYGAAALGHRDEGFALVTPPAPSKRASFEPDIGRLLADTLTAMRLAGPGAVYIDRVLVLPSAFPFPWEWPLERPFSFETYRLNEQFIPMLDDLLGRLSDTAKGSAGIAMSRFNLVYGRQREEDELIDIWVALEALFSPSDSRDLTYRIALRAAHYIGSSSDEREYIYNVLIDSYGLRSSVVHGRALRVRQTKKLKMKPVEAIELTQDYLRRALRKMILSDEPFKPEELDTLIARGG